MGLKSRHGRITNCFWSAALVGWALILLVLSIIPTSKVIRESNNPDRFRWDYLEHFSLFFILGLLMVMWQRKLKFKRRKELLALSLIIGTIYAASLELIQLFVPGRTFNPIDMYLNIAGLLLGIFLSRSLLPKSISHH